MLLLLPVTIILLKPPEKVFQSQSLINTEAHFIDGRSKSQLFCMSSYVVLRGVQLILFFSKYFIFYILYFELGVSKIFLIHKNMGLCLYMNLINDSTTTKKENLEK